MSRRDSLRSRLRRHSYNYIIMTSQATLRNNNGTGSERGGQHIVTLYCLQGSSALPGCSRGTSMATLVLRRSMAEKHESGGPRTKPAAPILSQLRSMRRSWLRLLLRSPGRKSLRRQGTSWSVMPARLSRWETMGRSLSTSTWDVAFESLVSVVAMSVVSMH